MNILPGFFISNFFLTFLSLSGPSRNGKKKFRFKNKLMGIDSSIIDLCLAIFDWVHSLRSKGGIKLHLLLDHNGYLPCFAVITEGSLSELKGSRQFQFDPGTLVVDDRPHNDYELLGRWSIQGVYFVTRMKENCLYEVIGEREVPKTEISSMTK